MAEPSAPPVSVPLLGSTADETPYVPVSWLAVAAATTAGLFALLLAIMGIIAFRAKRPLLEEPLLIFGIIAIVLSFAARRVIRNSEGTRTGTLFGIDLPNVAWWGGLVLSLGYGSYLMAIAISIGNDARNEVQAWTSLVLKGDAESLTRAFHRTQDPSQRKGIRPDDAAQMEGRWGKEYVAFKQCDLARILARNPDSKIEVGGLRTWQFRTTVDVTYSATLTNAEGTFRLLIPLRGVDSATAGTEGSAGRQWQIEFSPAGYVDKENTLLTSYGWYMLNLTFTGSNTGRQFMTACTTSRETRTGAFIELGNARPEDELFLRPLTTGSAQARSAVVGIAASNFFRPGPEFLDYTARKLFALPGGAEPDAEKMKIFQAAWNTVGIVKAGERLRDSTDINDQISFTDTTIEYRMPIEVPLPAAKGDSLAARGRLVMVCSDPAAVAEAKKLRSTAVASDATPTPHDGMSLKQIPWRVVRIESDLKPVRMEQRQQMGPPPPGGGPGM